ncbi:hypothetical protein LOD99_14910 [Oopsacas minuta]|uniref:Chloride channel CLIC-like protein 1 n=1 Tax=Oopsacas minuta TaxID=111878 RepID=A0AAV7KD96_9METZ|nr:hypothetical protein LOD99_14910 [Oopsacas minuta]
MFSSGSSKQTNKQDQQQTPQTRDESLRTQELYTKNLEIFAKRVINFFTKECQDSVNNKQPCLLLREINFPDYYYEQFSQEIDLQNKQTQIQEYFDFIQESKVLNLEPNNLTLLKEQQISISLFWKTFSDLLPSALLVSYAIFCVLVAYFVLKATFHRLSALSVMFSLFLFTFLVSVPYEYMRLYHEAIGERNAKLSQTIPSECLSKDESILSTFLSQFSFHDDHCLEWHLALTSSPLLMVSPAHAFSTAFTKFFTGPFIELSRTLSKAFTVLLIDIPFQWQIPLIIIAVLILLVLICIGCGYSFNFTPFISMRPTRSVSAPIGSVANVTLAPNVADGALEKQNTPPIKLEVTINTNSTPIYTSETKQARKKLEFNQLDCEEITSHKEIENIKPELEPEPKDLEEDKENIIPNIKKEPLT